MATSRSANPCLSSHSSYSRVRRRSDTTSFSGKLGVELSTGKLRFKGWKQGAVTPCRLVGQEASSVESGGALFCLGEQVSIAVLLDDGQGFMYHFGVESVPQNHRQRLADHLVAEAPIVSFVADGRSTCAPIVEVV